MRENDPQKHLNRKARADQLFQEGLVLTDQGQGDKAIKKYKEVLSLHPDREFVHYNIGLIYKYQRKWLHSLEYNQKAHELDPEDEASIWNLAIAATALRRWDIARAMWAKADLKISGKAGPIHMDFGSALVRLDPDGAGEVVWVKRICPVRAEIMNVPSLTPFHYKDVILHDGASTGTRVHRNREYFVFNELEVFEKSDFLTAHVKVESRDPLGVPEMESACEQQRIVMENWTESLTVLCKECSEGAVAHDHVHEKVPDDVHSLGFASEDKSQIEAFLDDWQGPDRRILSVIWK